MQADGVFQGGGVKGLGLVGALEAFADQTAHPETYVDDWVSLAGTSAGAIVAAHLACGHDVKATAALVKAAPYPEFCDYGSGREVLRCPGQPAEAPWAGQRGGLPHLVSASRSTARPSATSTATAGCSR